DEDVLPNSFENNPIAIFLCRTAPRHRALRPYTEAIQMPGRAQVDPAVHQCRRGVDVLLEPAPVQQLPVARGADNRHMAALAEEIDLAIAADRRAVIVPAARQALFLDRLAAAGIERGQDAAGFHQ